MKMKRWQEAEDYITAAEGIPNVSGHSLMSRYHCRIDLLIARKKMNEALEMIQTTKEVGKSIGSNPWHYKSLSRYYLLLNKPDEAIATLEEALSLGKKGNFLTAELYSDIAKIYFYRKKDFDQAEKYLRESDKLKNTSVGRNNNKYLWEQISKAKKRQK